MSVGVRLKSAIPISWILLRAYRWMSLSSLALTVVAPCSGDKLGVRVTASIKKKREQKQICLELRKAKNGAGDVI